MNQAFLHFGAKFLTLSKPETQVFGTQYITNFSLVIQKYQYLTGCTFLDTFQYYHYVSDTSLKSTKQIYENITKKNVVDFVLQLCFLAFVFMTSQTKRPYDSILSNSILSTYFVHTTARERTFCNAMKIRIHESKYVFLRFPQSLLILLALPITCGHRYLGLIPYICIGITLGIMHGNGIYYICT